MADLTGLTNDELSQSFVDHFAEAESRLVGAGLTGHHRRIKVAHALMAEIGGALVEGGQLSPSSVGGDK